MPKKLCALVSTTAVAAGSTPLLSLMEARNPNNYNTATSTSTAQAGPALGYGQVPLNATLSATDPADSPFLQDTYPNTTATGGTTTKAYEQLCAYRGS